MEGRAARTVGDRCVLLGTAILVIAEALRQGMPIWALFPVGLLILLGGHILGKIEKQHAD